MQIRCDTPGLTWQSAQAACQAAVEKASQEGWRINVAVVDRGGQLMAFLRMPGAYLHSIDLAIDKAYTAASFGFATGAWMEAIGHDEGMKLGFASQPRLIIFGGGLPIPEPGGEETWLGGIGVSGASEEQDEICAQAGILALMDIES